MAAAEPNLLGKMGIVKLARQLAVVEGHIVGGLAIDFGFLVRH